MKYLLTLAMLAWLTAGCSSSTTGPKAAKLGEPFELAYSESTLIRGTGLTLTFTALGEDSRCPEGAQCFWQGNARVVISVDGAKEDLNTGVPPHRVIRRGYTIELLEVLPYPKADEEQRPAEDYSVKLVVK